MKQEDLEQRLMNMFLTGDEPLLKELKKQYENSIIKSRKFTGAGFYTYYKVKPSTPPVSGKKNFEITDVVAKIKDIEDAMGFVLFVRNGYISWLEGYTISLDFWPNEYSQITLEYNGPRGERDYNELIKKWS